MIDVQSLQIDEATLVDESQLSFQVSVTSVHATILKSIADCGEEQASRVMQEVVRRGMDFLLRDIPF